MLLRKTENIMGNAVWDHSFNTYPKFSVNYHFLTPDTQT